MYNTNQQEKKLNKLNPHLLRLRPRKSSIIASSYKLLLLMPVLISILFPNLRKSHALLNLCNSQCWIQTFGACPRAVENSVASVQGHGVVQSILSFGGLLVSRIGDPAVGLEEDGWAEVFLAVPPVGGAGCAAACAKDAFVKTVEFLAVFDGLSVLTSLIAS
jgi:hypothetical protein